MNNVRTFLIFIVLTACLTGCTSAPQALRAEDLAGLENPSVHIIVREEQEPPVTGSFGWGYSLLKIPPEFGTTLSAANKRLHAAMLAGLSRKGLSFVDSEPDLLVSYALAAGGEIDFDELNRAYGDVLDASLLEVESDMHYKHGVLVIDVLERSSGILLWRGAIMAEIDLNWPEERKQERCNAAVKVLLQHYPRPGTINQ